MHEIPRILGVVVCTWNPSWKVEARRSEMQGHPQYSRFFTASIFCLVSWRHQDPAIPLKDLSPQRLPLAASDYRPTALFRAPLGCPQNISYMLPVIVSFILLLISHAAAHRGLFRETWNSQEKLGQDWLRAR